MLEYYQSHSPNSQLSSNQIEIKFPCALLPLPQLKLPGSKSRVSPFRPGQGDQVSRVFPRIARTTQARTLECKL